MELSPSYALEADLMRATIADVNLKAGVSYDESKVIAKYYFLKFQHRIGSVGGVSDRGRYWEVQVYSTRLDLMSQTIAIDKNTGRVSSLGQPTVENLQRLLAE